MYKVEAFIRECLKSILCQKGDFEVLAIDDGSPDKSGEIAMEIARQDRRLKVFRQDNQGLSMARNNGLKYAKGDYVWFVDSDDWVSPDSISLLSRIASKSSPEAINICAADVIDGKPVRIYSLKQCEYEHQVGINMIRKMCFHGVAQFTVYRRDFLEKHQLRFMPGIYHEDTEFSPRAYFHIKDMVCIDNILYLKRVNEDSITRTFNVKKNLDLVKVASSLKEFAENIKDKRDRSLYMRLSANAFKMAMRSEVNLMDSETKNRLNACLKQNTSLIKAFYQSDRTFYKIHGILLSVFQSNMLLINKILYRYL